MAFFGSFWTFSSALTSCGVFSYLLSFVVLIGLFSFLFTLIC